jgi:hypothetical protein
MDEVFARFLEKNGPIMARYEVPPSSIERYKGKLPPLLLSYWKEHGWCGYGEGIFWTVNPQDYEGVAASFIEGTTLEGRDTYHIYGENSGASLEIVPYTANYCGRTRQLTTLEHENEVQGFLLLMDRKANDFGDLFEPAKNKLGRLEHDEIYGFIPALALGETSKLERIERVKTVEHLTFLSQISTLEPYPSSDF